MLRVGNWGAGQRTGAGGALSQGEASFSPVEQINFEDKGIRLCNDLPLRLRAARPFSLFFSGGTCSMRLPGCAPWERWRYPPAPWRVLARSCGEGEIRPG